MTSPVAARVAQPVFPASIRARTYEDTTTGADSPLFCPIPNVVLFMRSHTDPVCEACPTTRKTVVDAKTHS